MSKKYLTASEVDNKLLISPATTEKKYLTKKELMANYDDIDTSKLTKYGTFDFVCDDDIDKRLQLTRTYVLTVTVNAHVSCITVIVDGNETLFVKSGTLRVEMSKTVYYNTEFASGYEYTPATSIPLNTYTTESGSFTMDGSRTISVSAKASSTGGGTTTPTTYTITITNVPSQYAGVGLCTSKLLTYEESAMVPMFSLLDKDGKSVTIQKAYIYTSKKLSDITTGVNYYAFTRYGGTIIWSDTVFTANTTKNW